MLAKITLICNVNYVNLVNEKGQALMFELYQKNERIRSWHV